MTDRESFPVAHTVRRYRAFPRLSLRASAHTGVAIRVPRPQPSPQGEGFGCVPWRTLCGAAEHLRSTIYYNLKGRLSSARLYIFPKHCILCEKSTAKTPCSLLVPFQSCEKTAAGGGSLVFRTAQRKSPSSPPREAPGRPRSPGPRRRPGPRSRCRGGATR